MENASRRGGTRRIAGVLFIVGAAAFAVAATVLSMTFDWPDILRQPANVVLPAFVAGGSGLVWTWFAVAWTYAILAVPILLLPAALNRRGDSALRVATYLGAEPYGGGQRAWLRFTGGPVRNGEGRKPRARSQTLSRNSQMASGAVSATGSPEVLSQAPNSTPMPASRANGPPMSSTITGGRGSSLDRHIK